MFKRQFSTKNAIWKNTVSEQSFPKLSNNYNLPVAIIGGGLCGVLTAYLLTQAGIHNILLEADRIGSGTTGHTTAKVTAGHNLIYHKIAKDYGPGFALKYAHSNLNAIQQYGDIIATEQLDCDWQKEDNYIYALTNKDTDALQKEYDLLKEMRVPCDLTRSTSLPFPVLSALKMPKQASFHPLKFLYGIAKNLNIYEQSKVLELDTEKKDGYYTLKTADAQIRAEHVVMCTHFPFVNAPGYYFLKMYQQRSYVLAIQNPLPDFQGMYLDCGQHGLSFRTYQDLLLIGGAGHRCGHYPEEGTFKALEQSVRSLFPKAEIVAAWSAQDCMTLDGIPYIGHFSKNTPGLYVATGFQKWGMTTSMVAANLITNLIQNKKNDYEALYAPNRFDLSASMKNIGANMADTVKGFTADQITSDAPICPHLGCKLTWNPEEESWDCPCHGSRFDKEGRILSNPAQKTIKF